MYPVLLKAREMMVKELDVETVSDDEKENEAAKKLWKHLLDLDC